jgi:hypothetical protein
MSLMGQMPSEKETDMDSCLRRNDEVQKQEAA